MASTKEVLEHHLQCFGSCDLDGIMADYAPDAVLLVPGGPRKGTADIAKYFDHTFAEFRKPGVAFEMTQQTIEGAYAYIVWSAATADNVYEMGTDTFVVQDGKIVAQSFAGKITPRT